MSSGRAWVSTWIVTSSGMRPFSISSRTKSKSVCDADGKPTSICLEAGGHQQIEHAPFARRVHRFDQGLVAVAQVDAAPLRGIRQAGVGPAAVGKTRHDERTVLGRRGLDHVVAPHRARHGLERRGAQTFRGWTEAREAPGSSVRRATQVQARTQHIAAGAGQFDSLLEVTHGIDLATAAARQAARSASVRRGRQACASA